MHVLALRQCCSFSMIRLSIGRPVVSQCAIRSAAVSNGNGNDGVVGDDPAALAADSSRTNPPPTE